MKIWQLVQVSLFLLSIKIQTPTAKGMNLEHCMDCTLICVYKICTVNIAGLDSLNNSVSAIALDVDPDTADEEWKEKW